VNTLKWLFVALNTIEPPVDQLLATDLVYGAEEWSRLRRPGLVEQVKGRLASLARSLDGRDYLTGRFSIADIAMTTVLRFIRHTDLVAAFPVLDAYLRRCEARPAFQKALNEQMAGYARNTPAAA
jgi:glutathione S-transferase